MRTHFILINGVSFGAGKDETASLIGKAIFKIANENDANVSILMSRFAIKLKKIVSELTGYELKRYSKPWISLPWYDFSQYQKEEVVSDNWNMTIGKILQVVGEGMKDLSDNSIWVKETVLDIQEEIQKLLDIQTPDDLYILLPDWRFPIETLISDIYLQKTSFKKDDVKIHYVKVFRDKLNHPNSKLLQKAYRRDRDHISETSLENFHDGVIVIDNTGSIEDLEKNCRDYVENYLCYQ